MVFNWSPYMLVWQLRPILALTWMEMLGISYRCGSHVISTFNEFKDFLQNETIEPAWPIHQGNLLCMDQSRWILKMTSLTRTHVYITQSFRKGRGGQPVSCMITLLVILLDMPITFNDWSWVNILTTIAILMIHWWCDSRRQLVLAISLWARHGRPPRHHCGGCKNIPLIQAVLWHQNSQCWN